MIMGCKCCKHLDDDNNSIENRDQQPENVPETNNNKFPIPKQEDGISFSQMLHYVHRYIWEGNFSSPIEQRLIAGNARVLNVKCGEGAWLQDNASSYRFSNFYGCDDSLSYVPNDFSFIRADILDPLRYDNNTFDFIFLSFGSYKESEWKGRVINELVRLCKPGGWIEIMDCENKFYNGGQTTKRLGKAYQLYLESKQINPFISSQFEELLRDTNQINNIEKKEKTCILGENGKRAGNYLLQNIVATLQESKVLLSESMGCMEDEYDELIQTFKDEVNKSQTSIKFVRVYGQKKE